MKKAIILFNLGGPDKIENVEPFLFNLFNDPAILNLPTILRYPLAKLISNRRAPIAKKIYEELGGSSPILKLTKEQSNALETKLNQTQDDYKCFVVSVLKICHNFCCLLFYSKDFINYKKKGSLIKEMIGTQTNRHLSVYIYNIGLFI